MTDNTLTLGCYVYVCLYVNTILVDAQAGGKGLLMAKRKAMSAEESCARYKMQLIPAKPRFVVKPKKYAYMLQGKGINALALLNQTMVDDALREGKEGVLKNGVGILFHTDNLVIHSRVQQVLCYIIQNYIANRSKKRCADKAGSSNKNNVCQQTTLFDDVDGSVQPETSNSNVPDFEDSSLLNDDKLAVEMTIADIAKVFDVNYRSAKRLVQTAVWTLYNLSVEWFEKNRTKTAEGYEEDGLYHVIRFLSELDIRYTEKYSKNRCYITGWGTVTVWLTPKFAAYLDKYAHRMWYPLALYKISPQYDSNAYPFGLKLALHVRMCHTNNIKVSLLLDSTTYITPYEFLGNKAKVHEKIIEPFTRGMNNLVKFGVLKYWYFYEPAAQKDLGNNLRLNYRYANFIKLLVYFEFVDYPEVDKVANPNSLLPATKKGKAAS